MESPEAPREHLLRALLDRYCDAWNRDDLDGILEAYNVPSFTYKEGMLHAFLDVESRRDYIARFISWHSSSHVLFDRSCALSDFGCRSRSRSSAADGSLVDASDTPVAGSDRSRIESPSRGRYRCAARATGRGDGKSSRRSSARTWSSSIDSRRPLRRQVPRLLRAMPSGSDLPSASRAADEITICPPWADVQTRATVWTARPM
jgi:hypothetical protein